MAMARSVEIVARWLWLSAALAACTTAASSGAPDGGREASVSCPEGQPASLTPCSLQEGTQCSYGDRCMPSVFACAAGAWTDVTPSTPPPPPCPASLPTNGSTCAACANAYRCDYNTGCLADGGTSGIGTCAGGHWLVGLVNCGD